MESKNVLIRNMEKDDIPDILNLYRSEKWLEGCSNLSTWLAFDPQGFKVAVSESGEAIGMCFAIHHGNYYTNVGGYIVKREYRGKGIGSKLWTECMKRIGTRHAALISVPNMVEKYQRLKLFPEYETDWKILMNSTEDKISSKYLSKVLPKHVIILPFQVSHLPFIYAYDLKLIGYDRSVALESYFVSNGTKGFIAFKKGKCAGFGIIQANLFNGCHVGPLYADSPSVAEVLLKTLIDSFPLRNGFEMTTISTNLQANDLLKKLCCTFEVEECVRLYRGQRFEVNTNSIFGLILDYAFF